MRRATDHAKLIAQKARIENQYARTKDVRDLTDVIRLDTESKKAVKSMKAPVAERKGIPIGQRWA